MNWDKIYKIGFSLFFIIGILLGINALLEGRWAFGLLCVIAFPILLYAILIKKINEQQIVQKQKLKKKLKSDIKPKPDTKPITVLGVLGAIIVIIAFFIASYYCNRAWDYVGQQEKLNCKSCSWAETRAGTCPYTDQELIDQEYGNNPWCRDMGNYEMLWKLSGMGTMSFMLIGLVCLGTLFYNIYASLIKPNLLGGALW